MKNIQLPIIILFALNLFGCGGESNDFTAQTNALQEESKVIEDKEYSAGTDLKRSELLGLSTLDPLLLAGSWTQGCTIKGSKSFKNKLTYEGANVKIRSDIYSDSLCKVQFSRSLTRASFEFGESLDILSGDTVNKIEYTVSSAVISFFDTNVISNFNNEQLCNSADWQIGTNKDISNCDAFKSQWNIKKDIFMLSAEGLFTGNLSILDDDKFPDQLNENVFLYREIGALTGDWEIACTAISGNDSYINSISFYDEDFLRASKNYQDSSCQMLDYSFVQSGTYIIGQEKILASGITVNELEFELESMKVAFYLLDTIEFLNNIGTCGTIPWVVGKSQEVIDCEIFRITKKQKDIFHIEDERLSLGANGNRDANKSPDELSTDYFSRK